MIKIQDIKAYEVLDSRGIPTIMIKIKSNNKFYSAIVPSGKSTGIHEAIELRDKEKRYNGKGVKKAIANIMKIKRKILDKKFNSLSELDDFMIKLDGTDNKSKLGANAILAVSMASARIEADRARMPLYKYLNKQFNKLLIKKKKIGIPYASFNILNGGEHAGNDLVIQEFMIIPKQKKFSERVRCASEIYHSLKKILIKKYSKTSVNVGDEGGFAPNIAKTEEALKLIKKASYDAGYKDTNIALDCAASYFYRKKDNKYNIDGKIMSVKKLLNYYKKICSKYNIVSIEDPFNEEDFQSFAIAKKELKGKMIVGDDLTVTNPKRVMKAEKNKSCNTLLLKINQIGTITEALRAAALARDFNWKIFVSHRSGDTEDDFIADLAVGVGDYIKSGAPCRSERTCKYNRILVIGEEL